ncbi:MAG: hypothetical protein ACFFCI_25145 [Promethearchaeota archaeon]
MFTVRLFESELVRVVFKTLSVMILCFFYSDLVKNGIKLSHSTYNSTNQELRADLRSNARTIIISGVINLAVVVVIYYFQFLNEILFEFVILFIISAVIHLRFTVRVFKKDSSIKYYSVLDGVGLLTGFISFLSVSLLFEPIIIHPVWFILMILSFGVMVFLVVDLFYFVLVSSRKPKSKWKNKFNGTN